MERDLCLSGIIIATQMKLYLLSSLVSGNGPADMDYVLASDSHIVITQTFFLGNAAHSIVSLTVYLYQHCYIDVIAWCIFICAIV